MIIISKKEKKSYIFWLIALIFCISATVAVAAGLNYIDEKQKVLAMVCLAVFGILSFAVICSIIWELRRPEILVGKEGEDLLVYAKGRYNRINIGEIYNVSEQNTKSRSGVLKCGTLTIKTQKTTYNVYNVKNVADARAEIKGLLCK